MTDYEKIIIRRNEASNILISDKSPDLKLNEVFQLYKEDLREHYEQFYYAMLQWKDAHLRELLIESKGKNNA